MNRPRFANHSRAQAQYERALLAWMRRVSDALYRALEPYLDGMARMDADEQIAFDFNGALNVLQAELPNLLDVDQARTLVIGIGQKMADEHKKTMAATLRDHVHSRNKPKIERIDLFQIEPWLKPEMNRWTDQNISLITRMPQMLLDNAAQIVKEAAPGGMRHETLAKRLRAALDVPEGRARLIARDQMAKWNSSLTEARYKNAGINRFIWRTARDRRVVGAPGGAYPEAKSPDKHGNHYEREGLTFLVGRLPLVEVLRDGSLKVHSDWSDGAPGQGIQCRCWQEPVIDGLEDLLDNTPAPLEMGGG